VRSYVDEQRVRSAVKDFSGQFQQPRRADGVFENRVFRFTDRSDVHFAGAERGVRVDEYDEPHAAQGIGQFRGELRNREGVQPAPA